MGKHWQVPDLNLAVEINSSHHLLPPQKVHLDLELLGIGLIPPLLGLCLVR